MSPTPSAGTKPQQAHAVLSPDSVLCSVLRSTICHGDTTGSVPGAHIKATASAYTWILPLFWCLPGLHMQGYPGEHWQRLCLHLGPPFLKVWPVEFSRALGFPDVSLCTIFQENVKLYIYLVMWVCSPVIFVLFALTPDKQSLSFIVPVPVLHAAGECKNFPGLGLPAPVIEYIILKT